MIHELIPWHTLIREGGIPALKVARRPMVLGEVTIPVGVTFDPELLPLNVRRERLRQWYESRLLELVDAPMDSRQFYREKLARMQGAVIEPITPVASAIVADLPSMPVTVTRGAIKPKPKSKGRR